MTRLALPLLQVPRWRWASSDGVSPTVRATCQHVTAYFQMCVEACVRRRVCGGGGGGGAQTGMMNICTPCAERSGPGTGSVDETRLPLHRRVRREERAVSAGADT